MCGTGTNATHRNKQAHAHSLGDTYTHTRFPSFVKCKNMKNHIISSSSFVLVSSTHYLSSFQFFIMNLFKNFMIRCEFEPCSNNETPLHLTYNYLAAKTKFFTVTVNYKQQQKREGKNETIATERKSRLGRITGHFCAP